MIPKLWPCPIHDNFHLEFPISNCGMDCIKVNKNLLRTAFSHITCILGYYVPPGYSIVHYIIIYTVKGYNAMLQSRSQQTLNSINTELKCLFCWLVVVAQWQSACVLSMGS